MSILLRKFIAEAIAADRGKNPAVPNQLISPDEDLEDESEDEGTDEVDESNVACIVGASDGAPPAEPHSRRKRRKSSARWK